MPIYEYLCTSCHHHFEVMQKISEDPIKECPECHKQTATKQISAAGFQLKGTGWYATDFKNKTPSTSGAPTKKEEPAKSTETSSTSSSSKPTQGDTK